MPARVRSSGLRQTKSRVPEVPEQETGAATLRVRRISEKRSDEPAGDVGGTMRVVRQRSRAGGVFAERLRLSPCLRSNAFHVEHKGGLGAAFRFTAFVVMIRLSR